MTSGEWRGLALIAAITLAVSGWLHIEKPQQAAASAPASHTADELLVDFVEIPAGPFRIGSDPAVDRMAYANERWSKSSFQGTVELPVFYIGRYEVTVAQFRTFVAATRYPIGPEVLEAPPSHPIASVSWPDALAYCRWLDGALRESPHTPPELRRLLDEGFHVSLPSEAQWEKAARGTDARIFPWGNTPRTDRANYQGSATMPVGSFDCPECPFGLSDMSGNVWELTRSPYRPYPFEPSLESVDLDTDALFVMRGGAYSDTAQDVRTAIRGGADPGARRPFIGFRVVLARDTQSHAQSRAPRPHGPSRRVPGSDEGLQRR